MELKPADLGGELAVRIIQTRVAVANAQRRGGNLSRRFATSAGANKAVRLGMLDDVLLRGSGLEGDTRSKAAAALSQTRLGLLIGSLAATVGMSPAAFAFASQGNWAGAGAVTVLGLGIGGMITALSLGFGRRHACAPLTDDEMVNLTVASENDALRQDFLRLARDLSKQDLLPETEENLRSALRSLGDALTRLPPQSVTDASPQNLQETAEALRAKALSEADPVTQASLTRQADAVERSAQAAERSALLTKRTHALRAELAAQIQSLRLGLGAFYSGDADAGGLAALSENVRTIAAEAVSVADARTELDAAPVYAPPAPAPQAVMLGR